MDTDPCLRVAFATSDMKRIDQHFGTAEAFAIHAIGARSHALSEVVRFTPAAMDGTEDKLSARIAALVGCIAVYCRAVGSSAVQQLRAQGIQPLKVEVDTSISLAISQLQQDLRTGSAPWLNRALASQTAPDRAQRFAVMEAEGWQE